MKLWLLPLILAGGIVHTGSQPTRADQDVLPESLSPAQAIRQPPGQRVTVEFRVGTATMAWSTDQGDEKTRFVFLRPDASLNGGETFEVILAGEAVTHLDNLGLLVGDRPDQFFDGKLIRVTGELQGLGPEGLRTFRVTVTDLDNLEVVRSGLP